MKFDFTCIIYQQVDDPDPAHVYKLHLLELSE